jgi:ATP-dependent RNA/DNA helicase, senataxin
MPSDLIQSYFAAFSKPVLDSFFSTIDKWELSIVLDAIKSAGISPGSKKTFSDLPTAVLYHILSAVPLFESSELLHLIEEHPPAFISLGWPVELPPGLLLLLFNEKREIRTWAHQQMVGCSSIDKDKFLGSYELVFQSITAALTSGARTPSLQADVNHTAHRPLRKYFTMSPSALWSGLQSFLRVLPSTLTESENSTGRAFRHAIIGHLHDKGSRAYTFCICPSAFELSIIDFPDVLRAFVFLIKKHGKFLWQGEDYDFPQVVFDSIKDNSMYLRLIQDSDSNPIQQSWFVQWFQVYLNSLNDTPIFGDVLRKIVGFACEELQHERFKDKRPSILASTLTVSLLYSTFSSKLIP